MKRILITGVSGFIGRALAVKGIEKGFSVFGLGSDFAGSTETVEGLTKSLPLRLPAPEVAGLIGEWEPEIVFHCAGSALPAKSLDDPTRDFECSVPVLQNLLDALRIAAPKAHLVNLSSAAVYGQPVVLPIPECLDPSPLSPYGYHKWIGEILCREYASVYGIRSSSARIFSAYGPGLKRQIIWDAIAKFRREQQPVFHGTGRETRDFIYIDDLVEALYLLAENEGDGHEVINVASGEETTISSVIELVAESLGVAHGSWRFSGCESPGIPSTWKADVARLREIGAGSRRSLGEGIGETVRWALQGGV